MQSYIGMKLGAYQIVEQIGQGGMATVFKAYQASMDRYVAIKVLPRHLSEDQTFVARFNQEARTLARLEHPHILPVHDYGEQDGLTYLVMRYVEAGTLKDLIAKEGPPSLNEVGRILDQVGRALDYAHSQGVLHRDIKPSNVLVDKRRDTFLTDFGIAKLVAETAKFTISGAIIGTPAYMSPEQGLGEPVDQRCDIYALGVLLYELVTGRVPYEAETPLAVVLKHINDPLPMPRQIRPDLSEAVERVILKAMAKVPADRWQSAGEMVEALHKAVAALPAEGALPQPQPVGLPLALHKEAAAPAAGPEAGQPGVSVEPTPPGLRPATATQPTVRERAAGPEPIAAAAPAALPARRRRRWLPIAGGAAVLLALVAVAVIALGGRGSRVTPTSTAPAAAATATQLTPSGEASPVAAGATESVEGQAAVDTPTAAPGPAGLTPGWTSYSNANLALSVARQDDVLWIGSEGGLVRFDLADDSYVKLGVADGLAAAHVNELLVDEEGDLWVATSGGLNRFDGEEWTTFDTADGLDSNWIETLLLDEEGALWAGTANGGRGLNYYDGSSWSAAPIAPLPVAEPTITALAGRGRAGLFVGLADSGLAHFDGQAWRVLSSQDGLPGNKVLDLMLAEDALWASFDDGLLRFNAGTLEWERVQEVTVHAMYAAQDGLLWFGLDESALSFDPGTGDWQPFEAPAGPFGRTATDISEGEDGVWFATYGAGAVRYDGTVWKNWLTSDQIGGNVIEAIRQGQDGTLWVTHPGTGLSWYDPARDAWQVFGGQEGALDWPSAPAVDSQGNLWIGGDGVLVRYDGKGWQALRPAQLEGLSVYAVEIGPGDVLWLDVDDGVVRYDPATESWTRFTSADHGILVDVDCMLAARDGSVWVGGEAGLVRFDGSTWSQDVAGGGEIAYVSDLAEAADGSLWLAGDGNLYHLIDGQRYRYPWPNEGYVDMLALAPDGSVWAGYEGVGRLDPASNTWEIFGLAEGLIDLRVTDMTVTPDGVVWIGTEAGLSRYVPPR